MRLPRHSSSCMTLFCVRVLVALRGLGVQEIKKYYVQDEAAAKDTAGSVNPMKPMKALA